MLLFIDLPSPEPARGGLFLYQNGGQVPDFGFLYNELFSLRFLIHTEKMN